jgi:geranylgeranyl pyrophosphate synthase
MLDAAQDKGAMSAVNDAVIGLGATNMALARLDIDADTLLDILDALGRATALAATAQQGELAEGGVPTRKSYFARTASKAALLIATGIWMGGRLATDDEQMLAMLKEFGLAEGMAIQIADDCEDLVSDLMMGVFTLPVIEGMTRGDDWHVPQLGQLLNEKPMGRERAEQVAALLAQMGALASARQVADAYKAQARTIFSVLPGLEPFFASRSSA